jgi:hypothetical protein
MQDYSIERLGLPNLDFTGELIGQSGGDKPTFKIYRTKAGKFIAEWRFGQQSADIAAEPYDTPALVVNWLKSRRGGFTPEVQAAIEDATRHDDSFKNFWNVKVE